jgi:hypothetical protein
MGEWRELAERLVELDLAIEDTDSWATSPDDIAELRRLERLGGTRYKPPSTEHRISRRLRRQLEGHVLKRSSPVAASDPRD